MEHTPRPATTGDAHGAHAGDDMHEHHGAHAEDDPDLAWDVRFPHHCTVV